MVRREHLLCALRLSYHGNTDRHQAFDDLFRSFYAKRTLRIFPLYFTWLALFLLALPELGWIPKTAFSEQIYFWTYTYNWRAIHGYDAAIDLGHFWTLAIEEQFYLVWPVVVFLSRPRSLSAVCLGGAIASLCFRAYVAADGISLRYDYFSTPAQICGLCLGGYAACALRSDRLLLFFEKHTGKLAACALGLVVLAAAAGRGFEANKAPALVFGQTGIEILSALVILRAAGNRLGKRSRGFLTAPALKWLGKYSYGIYVFHLPIRDAIQRFSPVVAHANMFLRLSLWFVEVALMIGLACLAAYLSFTFYESKFLKLKSRFSPS